MKQRSGLVVIVVVAFAYLIAVTQRATMGTAALFATEKFQTNAEQLSSLAVWQLVVYAAMQIPVGLLLDRFGPRVCLTIGAVGMAVGQFTVAFADTLSVAVLGRMLVGMGDAFTFISMIRAVNGWYQGKRASQLQQWLGNLGQLGQVLSAFEFSRLLNEGGWTFAFLTAASVGTLVGALLFIVVRDDSAGKALHKPTSLRTAIRQLRLSTREPSTRMAFYTHFSTQSTGTALLLLWGVPFLASAQQFDRQIVAALLSSMVFAGLGAGLVYAQVCAHFPNHRKTVVVLATSVNIFGLLGFVLWPGQPPFWVAAILMLLIGTAGPASMIAFDYSKQYVAKSRLGATNGFINIGGFLASFVMMFFIGVTLDGVHLLKGGDLYSLDGFRIAFLPVLAVAGFGLFRFVANESKTAREIATKQD